MLQLAYLLEFTHVQIDLLLILLFKHLPAQRSHHKGQTADFNLADVEHLLFRLNTMDDIFTTLAHGRFYFVSQLLSLLLERVLPFFKCLHCLVHRVQFIQVTDGECVQARL